MVKEGGKDGQLIIRDAIPMLYINRYKTEDQDLRQLSDRVMKYIIEAVSDISEGAKTGTVELQNSEEIFIKIGQLIDSNNYEERISAGLAMEDLCIKMQSYELGNSQAVKDNVAKMMQLVSSKYFNKKEMLLGSFGKVLSLMEGQSPWIIDQGFRTQLLQVCLS